MITIYNNPTLLDFIKVCARMPEDERKQIEAFSGEHYDIDGAAIGNFMVPGPKWVAVTNPGPDYVPIAVGGFAPQRNGVWRDFMLNTPDSFLAADRKTIFSMTRHCRRIMDAMFESGQAHRLECVVPAPRLESRPELDRWYTILGYSREGRRYGYCADGSDAISYARVKH